MKVPSAKLKNSATGRSRNPATAPNYQAWSGGIATLLEEARRQSARHINAILTATYWEIGRRIVEFAQGGEARADYGEEVLRDLSHDLTQKFGRGFAHDNLQRMRLFYLAWPLEKIYATLSRKSLELKIVQSVSEQFLLPQKCQTPSGKFAASIYATLSRKSEIDRSLYLEALCHAFPLSWSHYVRLLSVEKPEARAFYETESLRGGWSVRQLDRQISTLFYERTALAKNKAKLLDVGEKPRPGDALSVEEEIKNPFVLEFLGLRNDYAAEHLTLDSENPPVGLILCSEHDEAVARYSLGNVTNKILAAQYKLAPPNPRVLEKEIEKTRRMLELRTRIGYKSKAT